MGSESYGAKVEYGQPQAQNDYYKQQADAFAQRERDAQAQRERAAADESAYQRRQEEYRNSSGGGNGGYGGNDGNSGRPYNERQTEWAMAQETTRDIFGNISRVTLGTQGYTSVVDKHIHEGYGKTTGHKDGSLHRHGYMTESGTGDDFVRSNAPYTGNLGNIIGGPKK